MQFDQDTEYTPLIQTISLLLANVTEEQTLAVNYIFQLIYSMMNGDFRIFFFSELTLKALYFIIMKLIFSFVVFCYPNYK